MALLKTNSKEYKRNIEAYVFDCINSEEEELNTIESKIKYALSEFDRVANYPYNINKFPNRIARMADYLQGLPFDFAYNYNEILEIASSLHNIESIPEKNKDFIINNWFRHISHIIFKLADKYNIDCK